MTWPTGTEHSRPGILPNGGGLATVDLMIMVASIIVCPLLIFLNIKTFGSFCTIYDSYGNEHVCRCNGDHQFKWNDESSKLAAANQ